MNASTLNIDEHLRDDGTPWPYVLEFGNDRRFSDHLTPLIDLIIPGYASLPQDVEGNHEALFARWESAVHTAEDVQSLLAADRATEQLFNPNHETEEVLSTIFQSRAIAIEEIEEWTHAVPLVLITTDYQPFTERPAVAGDVWWVDPSDETLFLRSLHDLGLVRFWVNQNGDVAEDGIEHLEEEDD